MNEDLVNEDRVDEDRVDEPGVDLFEDLGRFETGAIPVDEVLRRGHGIRTRRRVAGGSALAVAAALSIAVPVAIAGGSGSGYGAESGGSRVYGATSSGGRVTVNPTPFSQGKGHFSGTVDGKPWNVAFDNKSCFYILWSCGFKDTNPWEKYGSLAVNSSDGEPDDYTLFLERDVARVTVTLQDGEVLRLEAVPVANLPVVLFALPKGLHISKVDLFDARGAEIAYSVPFSVKGSWSVTGTWYLPGQKAPTESGSVELARGDMGQGQEVITAYVGPSGPCVVTQRPGAGGADPTCGNFIPTTVTESFPARPAHPAGSQVGGMSAVGLAAPDVDHIQLKFADGTTSPVPVKSLGGYRFFAYIVPPGRELTSVTGYDAHGNALPISKNSR